MGLYRGDIGIMEKKMETTRGIIGISNSGLRGYALFTESLKTTILD